MPTLRFAGRPDSYIGKARLPDGHTLVKEWRPALARSERGYATFACSCGWHDRTLVGRKNWLAEAHVRDQHSKGGD